MGGIGRYDRDWSPRRRIGARGARYDREYDGGSQRRRGGGYDGAEFRRTSHPGGLPLYTDDFRRADTRTPGRRHLRRSVTERVERRLEDQRERESPTYPRVSAPRQRGAGRRELDARWAAPSHRRARGLRRPWEREWRPDRSWHPAGEEPRIDYDWAYGARRPDRYGWTGETGRG
jgi:hypothetical protein